MDNCGNPEHGADCLCDVNITDPVEIDPNLGYCDWFQRTARSIKWSAGDDLLTLLEATVERHDDFMSRVDLVEPAKQVRMGGGKFGVKGLKRFANVGLNPKTRYPSYAKFPPEVRKLVIDLLDDGLLGTEVASRVYTELGVKLSSQVVWNIGASRVAGKLKTDDFHLIVAAA